MVTESSEANATAKRERPESKGQSIEPFRVTFSPLLRETHKSTFHSMLFVL